MQRHHQPEQQSRSTSGHRRPRTRRCIRTRCRHSPHLGLGMRHLQRRTRWQLGMQRHHQPEQQSRSKSLCGAFYHRKRHIGRPGKRRPESATWHKAPPRKRHVAQSATEKAPFIKMSPSDTKAQRAMQKTRHTRHTATSATGHRAHGERTPRKQVPAASTCAAMEGPGRPVVL